MKKLLLLSVISLGIGLGSNTPVQAATIALFNNPQYITQDGSQKLINILKSFGHQVNIFTSFEQSAWQNATKNQLIFIPNQGKSILPNLSLETQNIIKNYVATGGGLIASGIENTAFPFLNTLFAWNIEGNFTNKTFYLNTNNAAGTIFETETAPSSVKPAFPTTPASIASLPSGAKSIYDNGGNSTALFVASFGEGKIADITFGYGEVTPEPGWGKITDISVKYVASQSTPTPIPEPSLLIGLTAFILGGVSSKKTQ
ncbi:hypothetical protein [Gloeothece verrucosa]|uniref:PEP-CTERM protein-sorting domain-containing protein n=1 Tax=Gloeothece verrucosa (strain PCC 7822) TaxID=497965 RepID=E0ULC3_GLOV7|nr:hypothetical protein [Gloeothece verrucosa]ADN17753.1 hypothetical protein Cyan7822_5899 [Gloeothece verrucosa PCC 7822]